MVTSDYSPGTVNYSCFHSIPVGLLPGILSSGNALAGPDQVSTYKIIHIQKPLKSKDCPIIHHFHRLTLRQENSQIANFTV